MKFKVSKGCELYNQLTALEKKIRSCNNAAFELVKELGYSAMRGKFGVIAGGVSSIVFKGQKPAGWRYAGASNEGFPMKRNANKELLAKIAALPVVEYSDLNNLLKFDWRGGETNRISFHPGIHWGKGYITIDIPSQYRRYKPVPGMVEILESEYLKLTNMRK